MAKSFSFKAKVRLWPGETAAWHFILVPKDISAPLREKYKGLHRGWNSIKVKATIGKTVWDTSIFYDTKSAQYLLPVKAAVRKQESLYDGDEVKTKILIV